MKDFKVYYGIPTYTQFESAKRAITGIIETSTLIPDQFVVIDNSGAGLSVPVLQPLLDRYSNIQVIPRQVNILSGAWNDLMNLWCDDYIIIANDDVYPHPHSIEALVTTARNNPNVAMVNGSGHSGNSYSFFLLRKWAYNQVGPFDERFVPAYFEDNDYDYRLCVLAGLTRISEPNATFDHIGSATVKSFDRETQQAHHISFARNKTKYIQKWGGNPGEERFTTPFDRSVDVDDD